MILFRRLKWSCRDFTESMIVVSLKDAEVHLWMYSWTLGTSTTLLDASLVIVSPHITHPVIRGRQIQAICFFLELYNPYKGQLSELSFSRVLPFGLLLLQHTPACSSGHGFMEKPFHSWVHITIFEHSKPASTQHSLSCIKSILHKRCFSTAVDSSTVFCTGLC